jgi:hypothetical protein
MQGVPLRSPHLEHYMPVAFGPEPKKNPPELLSAFGGP